MITEREPDDEAERGIGDDRFLRVFVRHEVARRAHVFPHVGQPVARAAIFQIIA